MYPENKGICVEKRSVPNIVLILADDLGWADPACYGSKVHETPHLDQFAREGVLFTDAYAAAPVCSPTRASLLTGKCPARLHLTIWREAALEPPRNRRLLPPVAVADLPHSETTIAKRLRGAGYLTALVGKWHLGDAAHYPETHGFDINIGGTQWGAPNTYFYPYSGGETHKDGFRYVPHLEFGQPGEYLTDRLTDEALKIIDRAGDRPFFVYLAHHAPHTPIEAKPADIQHCVESLAENAPHRNAAYAAMIRSLDENVGRVLAHLQERGLAERTIVIFNSDNGGYIGNYQKRQVTDNAPLRSGKGSLYEGGVRVPLIVRWPGVTPRGAVCHEPVLSTDLFYTLGEMAGLSPPAESPADGCSLAPLLKNPQGHLDRDALYFHYPHYYETTSPVSSIRAGDWKLLEYYEDHHAELYNLRADLSEKTDLAAQQPEKTRQLRDRLHAWLEAVDAQMPVENPLVKSSPSREKRAK
jgi:arylsulfatase A-like enzyme